MFYPIHSSFLVLVLSRAGPTITLLVKYWTKIEPTCKQLFAYDLCLSTSARYWLFSQTPYLPKSVFRTEMCLRQAATDRHEKVLTAYISRCAPFISCLINLYRGSPHRCKKATRKQRGFELHQKRFRFSVKYALSLHIFQVISIKITKRQFKASCQEYLILLIVDFCWVHL